MSADRRDEACAAALADLARDTVELVRLEIALARTDLSRRLGAARAGIASLAVGAAVVLAGLLLLLQALVAALGRLLPPEMAPWLSPLLVGAVVATVGWALLKAGTVAPDPEEHALRRAIDSLRRDDAALPHGPR